MELNVYRNSYQVSSNKYQMIYFYLRLYVLGWLVRNCNQTAVNLTDGLNVCIRITSLSITTISYEIKIYFEGNKTYSWLESDVRTTHAYARQVFANTFH